MQYMGMTLLALIPLGRVRVAPLVCLCEAHDCVDRLPTVAASQALQDLEDESSIFIPTGLDKLDKTLLGFEASGPDPSSARRGGLKRRQVTEVWGPPGSGKTALG